MADIFDEIGEDLRAERMQALLKRYGVLLIAAAVLVIIGVAGSQVWRGRQAEQRDQVAAAFIDATRKAAASPAAEGVSPSRAQAATDFAHLAATAPEGYRTLARLREATLRAGAGDLPAALQLWDQVSADTTADPLLRDLASLSWVQHQVDQGDPAAVEGRLSPLVGLGNPWRALALEQQSLLAIRTGQEARARDILKTLQADTAAPDGVRGRASGLLSRLGEAPPGTTPVTTPGTPAGVGG